MYILRQDDTNLALLGPQLVQLYIMVLTRLESTKELMHSTPLL